MESVIAKRLPPQHADGNPHGEVDNAGDEARLPPFAEGGVVGAEDDGRGAGGVVGEAHHDIACCRENETKEERRCAESDPCAVKGQQRGGDVRGGAGEGVVRVEVDEGEQDHRDEPGQGEGFDTTFNLSREVGDDAEFVQPVGHHDQRAEPDERIPSAFFRRDIAPTQHAADEQDAETEEGGRGRIEFQGGDVGEMERNIRPEEQQQGKDAEHPPFITLDFAEGSEFFVGENSGIGGFPDFRRVNEIKHQRHQQDTDHARNEHGDRPGRPAHMKIAADHLVDGVHHQRVRGGGGDEHAGSDGVGVVIDQGEIAPDLALRTFGRIRIEGAGDGFHDGVDDAAAARGVRRGNRCQDGLGQRQRIGDADGAFAEQGDEVIADAFAEAGLDDATGDHDGNDDEPDERVGKRRQGIFNRLTAGILYVGSDGHAGDGDQRHGNDRNRAKRQGLADDGGDSTGEEGEQMPAVFIDPCRHGQDKPDEERDGERDQGWNGLDGHRGSPG